MGSSFSRSTTPLYGPIMGPSMYSPAPAAPSFNALSVISKGLVIIIGLLLLFFAVNFIYNVSTGAYDVTTIIPASAPDQAPVPVDGKSGTVIPAANVPISTGSDNSVQFWMYIKDWDYSFGKEKGVLIRKDASNSGVSNPKITLHPTDNSLNVTVSLFASGGGAQSSSPAAANDTGASGDSYTCTVENVPLQTWFAVSATVFQRNLDVYINGKLVKSCVLPGVPRPAAGDITMGAGGGFSGYLCGVRSYSSMIGPSDASSFFSAGTNCASFAQPSGSTEKGITLFGYTYTFNVKDSSGKEVSNYSF